MNRLTAVLLGLTLAATSAFAVPAKRGITREGRLANGQTVTLTLRGDETFHYYTTPDGRPMQQLDNGTWQADMRDVKALHEQASARRNAHRAQLAQQTRRYAMQARRGEMGYTGTKRGLLILVNFTDVKMTAGTQAIYNQQLNGLNNPVGDNYGSVREFFRSQSYGLFDIEFDIVGPVTVSKSMSYYGSNDRSGQDKYPEVMIKEACQLADPYVDFSDYDWDGDGEVENIYVTYAGYGEAQGGDDDTIWPHQWMLSESSVGALYFDGVKVDTYATGSELNGNSGSTLDGIGTMCHEYGHCLGLPDFYDTDYENFGMSDWDIMDSGSYGGDGYCPSAYTSYERMFCGWLDPVELQPNTRINGMAGIEDNPVAYIIYNDANHDEYYLLENHTQTGWNSAQPGYGMLILHVDYDATAWIDNTVNNTASRQRMTIIPADNKFNYSTYDGDKYFYANAGDLYPNSAGNTELTDESTPAAKLYRSNTDGTKYMHKPVTDIALNSQRLISFNYMKGAVFVPAPVIDEVGTMAVGTEVDVAWSTVPEAVSYNLRYTVSDPTAVSESDLALQALTLMEDFENFCSDTDSSNEITDFDALTLMSGWTGEKVYKGIYGAKLGSSKKAGSLTTPAINGTAGTVTVYLESYAYNNDNSTIKVALLSSSGSVIDEEQYTPSAYVDGDNSTNISMFTFTGAPSTYKIKVYATKASKCRVHLAGLYVFDGTFSREVIDQLFESSETTAGSGSTQTTASDITGITATAYTLRDLPDGNTVTISVQAVDADGNLSAWSEPVSFTIDASNVVGVGSVAVAPMSGADVVYDLSGRRLPSGVALRAGIYVRGGRKHFVIR